MASFFASASSILVSMLMKLIGYEFISKVVVIGLDAWAKSTETKYDDLVVEAMAKAWDVDVSKIKELGK
jgi:hypothetical protein